MKVSTTKAFRLVYSLFQHEYLGYLFESFVIQLDANGGLTFLHQNISSKNAAEFSEGLNDVDFELIQLMDSIQQKVVIQKFYHKKIKPQDFFLKVYDSNKGDKALQEEIKNYLERRRARILTHMTGKNLFEMGNDGEPAWKQIETLEDKASVLFHFRRNDDNTHYFPTIKYGDEKVAFQYKGAYLVCEDPAWMVLDGKLYHFEKEVDGKKLRPFLNKKFIVIPRQVEETYYKKFVAPLVASFDVYAKGFEIASESYPLTPKITFSELVNTQGTLFDENGESKNNGSAPIEKMLFELKFQYGPYQFSGGRLEPVSVSVEKTQKSYIFHRVRRYMSKEHQILRYLRGIDFVVNNGSATLPKPEAFEWLRVHKKALEEKGYILEQRQGGKKYYLGPSSISIEVRENIDWFDIHTLVRFGQYEFPFKELRKLVLKKQNELILPNGEVAIIPEAWFKEYSELFAFMEEEGQNQELKLKKHHLSLVQELQQGELAKVSMSEKLQQLRSFEQIEDRPLPDSFKGTLRPYQKAGYNWLHFLGTYNFGGCLADDMGLGKTVQTLAMLQAEKENGQTSASLLIMPTSLIYNWEMEARKFTPQLKVFIYTGTNRIKSVDQFKGYDLILTSYGITRLDIDTLTEYYFHYTILDESQAIKNPNSHIAKAVKKLKSKYRLILTGTPLENSTLDLWSQMTFINPGLLGNQSYFKSEFLNPIEKKKDDNKTRKLNTIIKPFILRRNKSQVATELPEKVEHVQYCTMTEAQKEHYEEAKSVYRNKILDSIESQGVGKSQFLLLQGLTKLRQIANHPKLVDKDYQEDSGKLEDVTHMLNTAISKGHKLLIFSQFVKHLALVRGYLDNQNIAYSYLDGATKDRQYEVDRFQNEDQLKVFLISLKAGGLGLNLTKADYVFLLDPWWNPAVEAQAIDRAHRIGQENRVFTYKFISKNTVEEKILALQKNKLRLADNLIHVEENFIKSLSKEDISSLLA